MFSIPKTRKEALAVLRFKILGPNLPWPEEEDEQHKGEIRKAYYLCILNWHPDKWRTASQEEKKIAEENAKAINQAYSILTGKELAEIEKEMNNKTPKECMECLFGSHLSSDGSRKKLYLFFALESGMLKQARCFLVGGKEKEKEQSKCIDDINIRTKPNEQNIEHKTPMHYVIQNACENPNQGWEELCQDTLLKREGTKYAVDVNISNAMGVTLIHIAARYGRTDLMKILIDHGADVNVLDNAQRSPLDEAVDKNYVEAVRFLLGKGASISDSMRINVDQKKYSPEMIAMLLGHPSFKTKNQTTAESSKGNETNPVTSESMPEPTIMQDSASDKKQNNGQGSSSPQETATSEPMPKTREAALEVLGFNPKDKPEEGEIRKAYYKRAREWHTDKNESSKAKEKIQAINVAYGLLTGEIDEQFIKEQTSDDWTNRFDPEYFRNFCNRMYGDHISYEEIDLLIAVLAKDLEKTKALIGQVKTFNIEHRIQYNAIEALKFKKEYDVFNTLLHNTVRNACENPNQGWEEVLQEVLQDNKVNVDATILVDGTALCLASRLGHLGVVKMLLERGADPNLKGLSSPLAYAAKGNYSDIVEELFAHGAEIDHISLFCITTECNETIEDILLSNTSLEERNRLLKMFFCNKESCKEAHEPQNMRVIKLLLEKYGANPNYIGPNSNISSLENARDDSNKCVVELLEQHAKKQASASGSNQNNGQGSSLPENTATLKPMPGSTIIPGSTLNSNQNNGQGSSSLPENTATSQRFIIPQNSSSDNKQSNNTRSLLIDSATVAGAIIGAVALYCFAPFILGISVGIGAQLGLGIAGAAIGGGIGYLTGVAISCCSSKAHAA